MHTFSAIAEQVFSMPKPIYGGIGNNAQNKPIILSDFDGTISSKDVTDTLLVFFGQDGCEELEEQWLAGKIGSQECMSKQIALIDASLPEIDAALANIQIDPYFKSFIALAESLAIPIQVVSDGLDYAIQSILMRNGLGHLPVYANRLLHDNNRGWRLTFPYTNASCVKASGNCKCAHLQEQKKHFGPVIYVGDGASDFCVANHVDVVLAKNTLIDYCQQQHLNYLAINDFSDAMTALPNLIKTATDHHFSLPFVAME